MRTTLDIDDDLLTVVKETARRQGRSAGAVISELARRSLQEQVKAAVHPDLGFATVPQRAGVVVSTSLVDQILEESAE
ncbi:hypothetical protein [Pseudactinotalea sp.]|uniref:hypothetical protein n=1 Tax=Pseudactinotalea sp. TaxID=1926260 RepID=UPI003B3B2D5F